MCLLIVLHSIRTADAVFYDPSKVAYVEYSNGKVYVDNTLCKIVETKEQSNDSISYLELFPKS